jgi:glycosyltransferase involved in cell wall biosynthesis
MKEFASALARFVPTLPWAPVMRPLGMFENWERTEAMNQPNLQIRQFPLQRGYSRFPISRLYGLGRRQTRRMLRQTRDAAHSPLICTTPYYAPVAERWPGPVVYYQTDLTYAYHGLDPDQIRALDIRLCRVASVVCPNSRRIGHYMISEAGCDPGKIVVVPNATREANILPALPREPWALPRDLQDLPRPIAGVLGNLAGNLDWLLLAEAVEMTPEFSWAFIGPHDMQIEEAAQLQARTHLLARRGRIRFTGPKPYGQLQEYARSLDVAVLPYRRKEPTFSGSSTRFYEHLAACRPIVATRGFEELLHKEPLLQLADDASSLALLLRSLRARAFDDGYGYARWEASQTATWTMRAATLIRAIQSRWPEPLPSAELPAITGETDGAASLASAFLEKFLLVQ